MLRNQPTESRWKKRYSEHNFWKGKGFIIHATLIYSNLARRKTLFIQFHRRIWTWLVQWFWCECLCRILMEGKLYAMGVHRHVTQGPLQVERIILWFKTCSLFIRWSFFRRLQEPSSPINLASLLPSFHFKNYVEQFAEIPFWCFNVGISL